MPLEGSQKGGRMVQKRGTILLWILNFVFPGAALFWRKQVLQGICYIFAFGIVNAFRHEIGL
jgi:TM2 domain-containing membrane protein YozV